MDGPEREESQAGDAPAGDTAAAPTSTPAPDQLANPVEAEREKKAAHVASESQWTESPEDTGPQPPSTTAAPQANPHTTTRPKQHKHTAERPGKVHTRVPPYRGRQHHNVPPKPKLVSRRSYHHPEESHPTTRHGHRRAHSDIKLVGEPLLADIKRDRSHQDVARRDRSFDKLRAPAAGTKSRSHAGSPTGHPTRSEGATNPAEGDGNDDDDGEWVDESVNASTNASPYPRTPREPEKPPRVAALSPVQSGKTPSMSSADRDIAQHKEYLTSRLLHRVSSQNAPPQVSSAMASAPRSHRNSPDTTISQDSTAPATPNVVSGGEEDEGLTSRFLTRPGSTLAREGSFFGNGRPATAGRSLDDPALRRPRSMTELKHGDPAHRRDAPTGEKSERSHRRRAPPAEISRTQQKLNLQRASSAMEPQPLNPAPSMMGSGATLVGIPAPGYDGTSARDPRLPRLLEKAGMEYRVVRRYQNPMLRSILRLEKLPGWDAQQEVSRGGHARNSSLPPLRYDDARPSTPQRAQSSRGTATNGLVGGEGVSGRNEDTAVAVALRNLWEKPLDLSASQ
ncbi:hypothetical protein VUR80DRAFT_9639 [Thermomyces stellatus]